MDWFFFYGTLMDPDVLTRVLGRQVRPDELSPALLHRFRRLCSPGVVYPRLVEDAASRVTGLALASPQPADLVRLAWFEDGEYEAVVTDILMLDGRQVAASLFSAITAVLPPGAHPWCPMTWTAQSKHSYLQLCDGWMAGCPAPGSHHPLVRSVLHQDPSRAA